MVSYMTGPRRRKIDAKIVDRVTLSIIHFSKLLDTLPIAGSLGNDKLMHSQEVEYSLPRDMRLCSSLLTPSRNKPSMALSLNDCRHARMSRLMIVLRRLIMSGSSSSDIRHFRHEASIHSPLMHMHETPPTFGLIDAAQGISNAMGLSLFGIYVIATAASISPSNPTITSFSCTPSRSLAY